MTHPDVHITAAEAGALVGVSDETMRRWAQDGKVAAIRLPSGRYRFRREDVEALLVPTTAGEPR